ncbi:hypothetical protein Q9L58_005638 [Maublancomyces gigas]|uniref:Uncharacterized protein n=1 Tax=Discina gigas TaxID=1032678 RepID=A0ABR3GHQ7_9PEZI
MSWGIALFALFIIFLAGSVIKQQHSIAQLQSYGCTALHIAVLHNDTCTISHLLQHGADTSARTHSGWEALHLAAVLDQPVTARLLLQAGSRIGERSGGLFQNTPLHYAVLMGHAATAQVLLEHGADLGAQDVYGITVRCKAAAADHRRVVELVFPKVESAAAEMRLSVTLEVRSVRNDLCVLLAADEDLSIFNVQDVYSKQKAKAIAIPPHESLSNQPHLFRQPVSICISPITIQCLGLTTWTKQLVTVIVAAVVIAVIVGYAVVKFETTTVAAVVGIAADACDAAKLALAAKA